MDKRETIQPVIERTGRGLSIAGTRITLYTILELVLADWPPHLIRDWLGLTQPQIDGALAYLAAHRSEVERDYHHILAQAEIQRQYWETRLAQQLAQRATPTLSPEQAELRARFQAWKHQRHAA
jgi:uncharacterized protein (DUF433 family)